MAQSPWPYNGGRWLPLVDCWKVPGYGKIDC
jgi:hypothetical protein